VQYDTGLRLIDINGDHWTDLVRSYTWNGGPQTTSIWLNYGNTWIEQPAELWSVPVPFADCRAHRSRDSVGFTWSAKVDFGGLWDGLSGLFNSIRDGLRSGFDRLQDGVRGIDLSRGDDDGLFGGGDGGPGNRPAPTGGPASSTSVPNATSPPETPGDITGGTPEERYAFDQTRRALSACSLNRRGRGYFKLYGRDIGKEPEPGGGPEYHLVRTLHRSTRAWTDPQHPDDIQINAKDYPLTGEKMQATILHELGHRLL
jgi:hypothetical protein